MCAEQLLLFDVGCRTNTDISFQKLKSKMTEKNMKEFQEENCELRERLSMLAVNFDKLSDENNPSCCVQV
jgi:hypothetical protein